MKQKIRKFYQKNKKVIIIGIVVTLSLFLVIHLILGFFLDFTSHNMKVNFNPWYWLVSGFKITMGWPVFLLLLLSETVFIINIYHRKNNSPYTKTIKSNDYGNAKWLDKKEINDIFPQFVFDKNHEESGFLVASEKNKQNTLVNIVTKSHTLVIGGTGSGKTQGLVIPTIQTNAFCQNKPSMIISDPKGELYQTQSLLLKKQGYEIKVLNLRDPSKSSSWNPLAVVYEKWLSIIKLEAEEINEDKKEIIVKKSLFCYEHQNLNCDLCFKQIEYEFYCYYNHWFLTYEQAKNYLSEVKIKLKTQMRSDLKDLVNSIYPEKGKDGNNSFWNNNSRKLLKAVILGMLEDVETILQENLQLSLTEKLIIVETILPLVKFNLATATHIIAQQDSMIEWLKCHSNHGDAYVSASTVLTSGGGQLSGITGSTIAELELFEEPLIKNIICHNDFNFNEIAKKPVVIFMIIPDERTEYHLFVSLFVSQAYKALVEIASLNEENKLSQHVYFLLDEFANLPTINNIESMITVARSRNIFFLLVIQNLKQLENKYNGAVVNTIFANCSCHLFLQTMDYDTAEKYSKMIGQQTVLKVNLSKNGDKQGSSSNLDHKSLISASELLQLAPTEVIVIYSNKLPARAKLLPWYHALPHYSGQYQLVRTRKMLDFHENYYYDFEAEKELPFFNTNIDDIGSSTIETTSEIQKLQKLLEQYEGIINPDLLEKEMVNTINKQLKLLKQKVQKKENDC